MIVQAPDNKTIDFGEMPPDQVTAAMQHMYPPSQANQPTGQPAANGEQPAPNFANQNGDNHNLIQQLGTWAHSPTNVDLSDLPQSGQGLNLFQKLAAGGQAAGRGLLGTAEDMIAKPAVSGVTDLLTRMKNGPQPVTETSDPNILSGNELMTLGMLSPAMKASIPTAESTAEPVGNQVAKYLSQPSPVGEIEDHAFNQVMRPTVGQQPGSSLMAGIKARTPEEYQDAAQSISDAANPLWKQMRQAGDALKPDASNALMENITKNLSSPENKYIPQLNPKTTAIIEDMKTEAAGGSLGVSTLDQYRRMLSRVGGSEDGFSAGVAKRTIDKYLAEIPDEALASGNKDSINLLNQARAQSAAGFRAQDVADILTKANGDPNRIKAGLTKFVSDDDNLIGFSQEQKDALRYAADTGFGENILKAFGKFGLDFSKSGTGNTVLPALMSLGKAGAAPFIPGGIPAVMAATAMRQGQKYMARGAAEKAFRLLEGSQ